MIQKNPTAATVDNEVGSLQTVGISQFRVSKEPRDILVTYSLGSCLGVAVYDSGTGVAGLIHCMLPISKGSEEKAREKPAMFVDTGLVALLNAMYALGANKNELIVKVAGAASPMEQAKRFRIGERNYAVLRKVLWKNDLLIKSQEIGGTAPRTVRLYVGSGRTTIKSAGKEVDL